MSKLANMFSLLNLEGEDDGEDDREVTQTSYTSIGETASSKPGWYSFSPRMCSARLQSSGFAPDEFSFLFLHGELIA
jgi:hypothetical protein